MDRDGQLYVDLLKKVLTNVIYEDAPLGYEHVPIPWFQGQPRFDVEKRRVGLDWPSVAHTMVGLARLENVQWCMEQVVADGVPGDFIETGVWRGGVCIFMRAFLHAHGIRDRRVWVADSFEGIPDVGEDGHPLDVRLGLHRANNVLAVPMETVQANFARYGLLDDQVRFLPGWFRDSLPGAPVERLSILRLDGDLHASTMDALTHLYHRLSPGGFVIVDDYALRGCRRAVDEFRELHGIDDAVERIDDAAAFWRRSN